jgi:hypothetical protein
MIRRRSTHDPLADRVHPHWLAIRDMAGTLLEVEPIALGTDLHAFLARTIERMAGEGWMIESDGRYGSFFCHREGMRRIVHLQIADPDMPQIGPSTHPSCPGCGE